MIHKEGTISLILGLLVSAVLIILATIYFKAYPTVIIFAVFVSFCIMGMLIQFFRNPKREVLPTEGKILSPADGTVVVIEETNEMEYLQDRRIQLSIFMSPFNVHVNRNPVGGIIEYVKYHPGKFLVAWHPKSSTDNERTTVVYKTNTGAQILIRQIAGAMARRIVFYVKPGMRVIQGEQMGFIKFGSRVDLLLPPNSRILVNLNEKVIGGKTVIAEFE